MAQRILNSTVKLISGFDSFIFGNKHISHYWNASAFRPIPERVLQNSREYLAEVTLEKQIVNGTPVEIPVMVKIDGRVFRNCRVY